MGGGLLAFLALAAASAFAQILPPGTTPNFDYGDIPKELPPLAPRKQKLRVISWDLGNQTIDYLAQRMIALADFIQG